MNRKLIAKRVKLVALALGASLIAASCFLFPIVPAEKASDASFVRQAVPVLQGRKIRGYDEVKLLSDLIGVTNREIVLRALMAQPRFVDHWSEVLVDDLRVDREGFQAQTACFGNPLRALPVGSAVAQAIVNNIPQQNTPGGAFNMSDVIRSAIELDNLYPIYRANLYPPVTPLAPFIATDELQSRDMLGAKFGETYLNRQMGCLICHNSEFSLSGQASGWNRTHPILGLFEKSLFGASTGEPTKNAYAMFRSDARNGSLSPWGLQSCGTFKTSLPVDPENAAAHFIQPQGNQFGIHDLQGILQFGYLDLKQNGLQRSLPPMVQQTCNFCKANCQGTTLDIAAAANSAPNAAQVKSMLLNSCQSCHGGAANLFITNGADWANDLIAVASTQKAGETLVIPGNANGSYLIKKLTNSGIVGSQMPLGASPLSNANINTIRAWINGLPQLTACAACQTTDCGQFAQEVQGHEALAYLLAARVVNNVWDEVMGSPVTIANYFPRHFEQRQILWNLTEYKLLPTDWSLKDLLVRIMTSDFFNRVPPRFSAATTPYNLPPVFDPWTVADPRVPPVSDPGYDPNANPQNHKNAMSESVYRYSARSLTNSVHEALGWPAPQRFPGASYPSQDLMRSIGLRFSDQQSGFQTVDFQGLLAWETVHGTCTKPSGVATDWIDRLVTAINNFDPNAPGGPLTVGDVATVIRDWLLAYGGIGSAAPVGLSATEADAISALFGVASLAAPLSTVTNLETKLRQACGIALESPQFQLAGIAEKDLGPKPRLRVCNTPECSYRQMCMALRPAVNALLAKGESLLCGDDSVNVIKLRKPPILVDLCPAGLCGIIQKFIPEGCPLGGELPLSGASANRASLNFCPTRPPMCDPRCSQIDCCGGPLPIDGLQPRDVLVAWADGGEATIAEGVQIRAGDRFEPLQPGRKVAAGDLIALPPGSRFELRTREGGILRTPARGLPKEDSRAPVLMMISGESALRTRQPDIPPGRVPTDKIKRILESATAYSGEGGIPLNDARRSSYKYPESELHVEDLRKRGLLPQQLKGQATKR